METYLEWLDAQWAAGKRNGTELWRRWRTQGFRCSRRVVSEWATRRKRADKADAETLNRIPSARTIARLLTTSRDNLTKSETVTIAAIEGGVPLLVKARDIIADFHHMIRRKVENELQLWIDRARESGPPHRRNVRELHQMCVRAKIGCQQEVNFGRRLTVPPFQRLSANAQTSRSMTWTSERVSRSILGKRVLRPKDGCRSASPSADCQFLEIDERLFVSLALIAQKPLALPENDGRLDT